MTSDDRLNSGLILDMLDVLERHGYHPYNNRHTGQAIGAILDLAYVYDGTRDVSYLDYASPGPHTSPGPSDPDADDAVILTGAEVRTVVAALDIAAEHKQRRAAACAFLSADDRTPLNAQEGMSDDHSTYRTAQPGSSDDHAISSSDGMDQPGAPPRDRPSTDRLIGIREIRQLFDLGRTAAYDLTHRPGFPAPVPVSRNAYRWWASEVAVFTAALRADSQNPSGSPRRRAQQRTSPQEAARLHITGKVRAAHNRRTPR